MIGAYALAAHHYVRATADLDLAAVTSLPDLQQLKNVIEEHGYRAKLNFPDEADPLGGVLAIWVREDEDGDPIEPVEIVNFLNPYRPRKTPASDAIRRAIPLLEKPALRYVQLADLIAMKLDAGGPADVVDVMRLLEKNPTADREEIRATCKRYGFDIIDTLIAEAS
ncbi:MAG: hypothetical protein M4D80_04640 [Myxococcota bacterium]|nr:hypothetical protein [Deltaproteobacteria bacterium]MDQ3334427.1 hypothetical protein [Myxococcota bacterium]